MTGRAPWLAATVALLGAASLLAILGASDPAPRSPLWWLQYPLLALLAWALWTAPDTGPRRMAPFAAYVALAWALGMAVELTLTVDGTGIGGIHPDTVASFVLAQGDYLPLAAVVWAIHARLGCGIAGMTWLVAGAALTEGLVFTGSVLQALGSGAILGTVLVAAYLVALYLVYLVVPLRILGVGRIGQPRHPLLLLAGGFVAAFAVRLFWGLVYAPLVTALLDLPPQ